MVTVSCLGVLDFTAFIVFFESLLSRKDFPAAVGVHGKILSWFGLTPSSICGMGCNSGGYNFNAGWAIGWCGRSDWFGHKVGNFGKVWFLVKA